MITIAVLVWPMSDITNNSKCINKIVSKFTMETKVYFFLEAVCNFKLISNHLGKKMNLSLSSEVLKK